MTIIQGWEKDGASPQPIFVIGERSWSQADTETALEQFEGRDVGLTKREYLIAAIAGPVFASESADESHAKYVVSCADAIIDELQYRDDRANESRPEPPAVRDNG